MSKIVALVPWQANVKTFTDVEQISEDIIINTCMFARNASILGKPGGMKNEEWDT